MRLRDFELKYNVTSMITRPLYFGLMVNIMIPVGLLFICFLIDRRGFVPNKIPETANLVFWLFVVISLGQAALALWWRYKRFQAPMVRKEETFEADVASQVFKLSKPIFLLIASISIWTYVYFYLTGRFETSAVFVVGSFVVFQLVRPRYGSLYKLISRQEELVAQGKFRKGGGLLDP